MNHIQKKFKIEKIVSYITFIFVLIVIASIKGDATTFASIYHNQNQTRLLAQVLADNSCTRGRVIREDIQIHSTPNLTEDNVLGIVHKAGTVYLTCDPEQQADDITFVKVDTVINGHTVEGWVSKTYLTFQNLNTCLSEVPVTCDQVQVVYEDVNLRSTPNFDDNNGNVITVITVDQVGKFLREKQKDNSSDILWSKVSFDVDGNIFVGWVSDRYLQCVQ